MMNCQIFEVEREDQRWEQSNSHLEQLRRTVETSEGRTGSMQREIGRIEANLPGRQQRIEDQKQTLETFEQVHNSLRWAMYFLPKNQETIDLLDRWLTLENEYTFADILVGNVPSGSGDAPAPRSRRRGPDRNDQTEDERQERREMEAETFDELQEDYRSRSAWQIIGTSLLFELCLLAISCWIFVRRDF